MISKNYYHFLIKFSLICIILSFLQSCEALKFKRSDVKDNPINDADKREKNIREGKGITLGANKGRPGSFDFASSNEMWRATIEILDFVPLSTADYGGGVIITDWYKDDLNSKESIKIMVNFLSNEIRADGLKVKVYKKTCDNNFNCDTQLMSSTLEEEIKLAVLKKAAKLQLERRKKRGEESEYRVTPTQKDKNKN